MTSSRAVFLLVAMLGWLCAAPKQAFADDADPFSGLIAGTRVADETLEEFTGKGIADIGFAGGVNNGSVSGSVSSTVTGGAFGGARGIMNITQFNGDGNTVSVSVNLTVNINTTTITNSTGLSVTGNNSFSLSGTGSGLSVSAP